MEYKDWLVAIYDKFCEKEKIKYPTKKIKELSFKQITKLIVAILFLLIGISMYIYGLLKSESRILIVGLLAELIMLVICSTEKMDIRIFKNRISVLEEVLKEEELNNEISIKKIEKDSRGILSKIQDQNILNLLGMLGSFIGAIGITTIIQKSSEGVILIIALGTILLLAILTGIYFLLTSIPITKTSKKKQLNGLLKILIVYRGYN